MSKSVAFRVDASNNIGSGHVMRCLTLGTRLRDYGLSCYFICRMHNGNLVSLIEEKGFDVIPLPSSSEFHVSNSADEYENWLGVSVDTDIKETISSFYNGYTDWLVVDHYALDINWEVGVLPYCGNLLVIDDLANRQHYCDVLIDQNYGRAAEDYNKLINNDAIMLLGTNYAILRSEFAIQRPRSLQRRVSDTFDTFNILITMGGVDKNNVTARILKNLNKTSLPENAAITVVLGRSAPWVHDILSIVHQMSIPTRLELSTNRMAELMSWCDFAIGAAGSTSWERCCLGVPSVQIVLANNQKSIANQLELNGCAITIAIESIDYMLPRIINKLTSRQLLKEMSHASYALVDGHGCDRVCETMLSVMG